MDQGPLLTAVVVVVAVIFFGLLIWSALKWKSRQGGDEHADDHNRRCVCMGRSDCVYDSEFSNSTEAMIDNEFVVASRLGHARLLMSV
jgi:hypothetical protein